MGTTTNFALRYPASSDTPDGPTQIQNLADDVDDLLDIPYGHYYRNASADVAPADGTWLDIAIQQVTVAGGGVSIADSRHLTVPVAGIYVVSVSGRLNCATAAAQLAVAAGINQSTTTLAAVAYTDAGASNRTQTLHDSGLRSLAANDTLTLYVRGNGATISVGAYTGLSAYLIRAL